MLPIVKAPNPVLLLATKKVKKVDSTILSYINEMTRTLVYAKDPEGVGLAAPQVGLSLKIFIIKPTKDSPRSVFINPEMTLIPDRKKPTTVKKPKKKGDTKLEGCLSLDNIWGIVHRNKSVMLTYMDENGVQHEKKFTGFMATIIQHEVDHLHGILFPKRVLEQKEKLYKTVKDVKGETVFEEIGI